MNMRVAGLLTSLMMIMSACATMSAPPSVDVTGAWVGTWEYQTVQQGSGDLRGTFQQDGAKLSGNFDVTGPVLNHVAILSGGVSGNEVVLSYPATGRLTVNGNEMNGIVNGLLPLKVTLRRQ